MLDVKSIDFVWQSGLPASRQIDKALDIFENENYIDGETILDSREIIVALESWIEAYHENWYSQKSLGICSEEKPEDVKKKVERTIEILRGLSNKNIYVRLN